MDRAALTARVRRLIAEESTERLSDQTVWDELNFSQQALAEESGLILKETVVVVPALTWSVAMPADFSTLGPDRVVVVETRRALEWTQPEYMRLIDPGALSGSAQQGSPVRYYITEAENYGGASGKTLLVHPNPVANCEVRLTYHAIPAAMAAAGDTPWNGHYAPYHDIIALDTAKRLFYQLGTQAASVPVWFQLLEARRVELTTYLSQRENSRPLKLRAGRTPHRW